MKPSILYRTASILLLLFAAGHTLGFRQVDAAWGVDAMVASMKSMHFNANGSDRTYWDFFTGFGLFVSAYMVFAAIVAWQLGSLPAETLARMRGVAWGFAICMGFVTWLSWRYFFLVPFLFSSAILVCVAGAAWLSRASHSG
jgi:hypothetical protein